MVVKIKFNANSKILLCKFKINSLLLRKRHSLSTFSSKVQKGTKLDYIISQMHLHSKDLLGIKSDKEELEKNHGGYLYLH